jgi:thiamine-phosphate pyrophosphorylase
MRGNMAQLFLIAPPDAEAGGFAAALARVLEVTEPSALLLPRGNRAENAYKALVKAVAPIAQARDVAVLIEGEPGDVRKLGADGLHVTGDLGDLRDAVAALKPEFIVGAVAGGSRHEAMSKGELDLDYVFFGPLSGPIDPGTRELARWWAETMQVPAVLSDPEAAIENIEDEGCEFAAPGASVWATP